MSSAQAMTWRQARVLMSNLPAKYDFFLGYSYYLFNVDDIQHTSEKIALHTIRVWKKPGFIFGRQILHVVKEFFGRDSTTTLKRSPFHREITSLIPYNVTSIHGQEPRK